MTQKFLYVIIPFFLTGCVGSLIGGHTGRLDDEYPDIRTVPERKEASQPRGLHKGDEKVSRTTDFKNLKQDRERIKARDEALREDAFLHSSEKKEINIHPR